MALAAYHRFAYARFGELAGRISKKNPRLEHALGRAHIYLRPDVYLAAGILTVILVVLGTFVPIVLLAAASAAGAAAVPARMLLLLFPVPFIAGLVVLFFMMGLPEMRAMTRAREINAKLPYALNYITTMATAGATPQAIFGSLAKQPIYGAVAHESSWITRDMDLLGMDVVTALQRAADRSSSVRMQDFLQGAITALTSGGELKVYFQQKAEQYLYENRQDQKRFIDGLGVLAEAFVTVVVAAPLFLMVILFVMSSMGGSAYQTLLIGYVLILVLLPLSQLGFAVTVKVMTPEA